MRVGANHDKGIHLREGVQRKFVDFNVNIEPVFFNDKEAGKLDRWNANLDSIKWYINYLFSVM